MWKVRIRVDYVDGESSSYTGFAVAEDDVLAEKAVEKLARKHVLNRDEAISFATGKVDMLFAVGDRVQLHPGTDAWMRGDRYGEIKSMSAKDGEPSIKVKLDKSGKTTTLTPGDIQEVISSAQNPASTSKTYTVHGHIERRDGRKESMWSRTGLSKSAAEKLAREQRCESGGVARIAPEKNSNPAITPVASQSNPRHRELANRLARGEA